MEYRVLKLRRSVACSCTCRPPYEVLYFYYILLQFVEMLAKKRVPRMRHNYEVAPGVMRFSAARMYAKRGAYAKKTYPTVEKKMRRKVKFVVKPIGGDKNGKERKVLIKKEALFTFHEFPSLNAYNFFLHFVWLCLLYQLFERLFVYASNTIFFNFLSRI